MEKKATAESEGREEAALGRDDLLLGPHGRGRSCPGIASRVLLASPGLGLRVAGLATASLAALTGTCSLRAAPDRHLVILVALLLPLILTSLVAVRRTLDGDPGAGLVPALESVVPRLPACAALLVFGLAYLFVGVRLEALLPDARLTDPGGMLWLQTRLLLGVLLLERLSAAVVLGLPEVLFEAQSPAQALREAWRPRHAFLPLGFVLGQLLLLVPVVMTSMALFGRDPTAMVVSVALFSVLPLYAWVGFHARTRSLPATGVPLLRLLITAGCLASVVLAVPNLRAMREAADARACRANRRTLDGAVEMYQLDFDTRVERLDMETLVSNGYSCHRPHCPALSWTERDAYRLVPRAEGDQAMVTCRVHGR